MTQAAILEAPGQPLVIADGAGRQARPARGADPHRGLRPVPFGPALHRGHLSARRCPAIPGTRRRAIVEEVGSEVRTVKVGRRGRHVPLGVLRTLRILRHRPHGAVPGRRHAARPGRGPAPHPPATAARSTRCSTFRPSAEMMLIHEHACVAIDPEMPLDRAAVIGCAVTTGAGTIFNACKVTPGETVAVIGCGGVGLATINAAKIAGAGRIIAADPMPEKRELAMKLGATDTIDALANDAAAQIVEMTKGGVDHAIEAVGRPASALAGGWLAAPRRHRHDPRHDAAERKGRAFGDGPAIGQEAAGRDHGHEPLPGRSAAAGRFLHARAARSRYDHRRAHPA